MPMVSPGFVSNCWQRFSRSAHSESVIQTSFFLRGFSIFGRPFMRRGINLSANVVIPHVDKSRLTLGQDKWQYREFSTGWIRLRSTP